MKTVGQYEFAYEAHIARTRLEAAGIMAAVEGEVSSYTCLNAVNPIRVIVRDEDCDEALRILSE